MSVLVYAEHDGAAVLNGSLCAVAAARELAAAAGGGDGGGGGDGVHLLICGEGCHAAAEAAAAVEGVSRVLLADAPAYAHGLAEPVADLLVRLAGRYDAILAAHTTSGKNVLPRAAALLDIAPISDIIGVESADTFVRPIYAGNAIATVRTSDAKKAITVRVTAFEAAAAGAGAGGGGGAAAEIEEVEADGGAPDNALSRFIGQELTRSERPELTSAGIVISGGRGMQSGDNFHLLEAVADRLGAAVGASRAAVDAGFVPNDYQVGQTGKVVAPDLYIAVGISGAIQHLAGMKDSKVIVAINKDEEAPIFQVADYGLVADLFKALPELDAELAKTPD